MTVIGPETVCALRSSVTLSAVIAPETVLTSVGPCSWARVISPETPCTRVRSCRFDTTRGPETTVTSTRQSGGTWIEMSASTLRPCISQPITFGRNSPCRTVSSPSASSTTRGSSPLTRVTSTTAAPSSPAPTTSTRPAVVTTFSRWIPSKASRSGPLSSCLVITWTPSRCIASLRKTIYRVLREGKPSAAVSPRRRRAAPARWPAARPGSRTRG